ncbi:TRAP transporter small permease [Arsenicitalea aurantiaca]|uniref:TRAP transporter small permease protein n=1 Tax=Arsenicitalea aurantiaca TaxID=1783274 RepID=A0A433XKZ7_9HYPH|nr:TRAP transporter small permease [Arsenicitalea aurantiaca]RUT34760.1 TRAP transporter small permease [Arsenicitalea aurantiaca]
MTHLRRIGDLLERAGIGLAGTLLAVALGSISAQIFFRYVLGNSLSFAEELARYALIWSAMVGGAVAYRQGAHVAMTMAVERFPGPIALIVGKAVHLFVAAFAGLLAYQGWAIAMRNFARQQLSPALQIEIGWIYLAIPVGGALLLLAAIEALFVSRTGEQVSAL